MVGTNGGRQIVNVAIEPLSGDSGQAGTVMIVFTDVAAKPLTKTTRKASGESVRLAEMEQELVQSRQEVQSMREEMQSSQEELKSANEELQSTNEELTTSKKNYTRSTRN